MHDVINKWPLCEEDDQGWVRKWESALVQPMIPFISQVNSMWSDNVPRKLEDEQNGRQANWKTTKK